MGPCTQQGRNVWPGQVGVGAEPGCGVTLRNEGSVGEERSECEPPPRLSIEDEVARMLCRGTRPAATDSSCLRMTNTAPTSPRHPEERRACRATSVPLTRAVATPNDARSREPIDGRPSFLRDRFFVPQNDSCVPLAESEASYPLTTYHSPLAANLTLLPPDAIKRHMRDFGGINQINKGHNRSLWISLKA